VARLSVQLFGGINQNDQEELLINRSYQANQGGFSQIAPMEFTDSRNTDFDQNGIRKRKGSIEHADLETLIQGININDELIDGILWSDPATDDQYEVIVTKYSIVKKKTSDSVWTQINDSASAAYTHSSVASKCSFAAVDGHLFIGLDGANNYIQVYRSGDDLDDELDNGNTYEEAYSATTQTITGTWTKATFMIEAFQNRLIFSTGNTLVEFTPQANTESSGIWDGTNNGFVQSVGKIRSITAFAPQFADQINEALYLGTDGGFDVTTGFAATDKLIRIEGAKSPINHTAVTKALNWIVYLTDDKNIMGINGANVIDLGRRMKRYDKTGRLDDMSVSDSRANAYSVYNKDKSQVLIAFTDDFSTVNIDGGDATTSSWTSVTVNGQVLNDPIDGGAADTTNYAFAIDSGQSPTNQSLAVLDFQLGEPLLGESQNSFERRVRNIRWDFTTFDDNVAYNNLYEIEGKIIAVLPSGKLYEMENGNKDLASFNIPTGLTLPILTIGFQERLKQWQRVTSRVKGISPAAQTSGTLKQNTKYIITNYVSDDDFTNVGAASNATNVEFTTTTAVTPTKWTNGSSLVIIPQLTMTYNLNRADANTGSDNWDMYGSGLISNYTRFNRRSEDIKIMIDSDNDQEWVLYNLAIMFEIGAEILQ
jgi:hypothetical protein